MATSPSRDTGTRASSGRPGRLSGLPIFALAIGALGVLPVRAQSREDLSAAARRLRQVEASLERLPDTGITRDAGEIAVIEHDGSSYDARRPDGTLNYEARLQVGRRFYEAHPDEFDFLVVFTNFPFETSDATAFHLYGRNDVDGIGKPVGSVSPAPFGSPSRLKGWIDMADVGQYRERPFSLEPGDAGLQQTLGVLAHEMGHQWLAEARYRKDGVVFDDLLGADEMHWSYLLDSDGSFLYGADWRDNEDGTFTAAAVRERFSSLDLYLMGLLPPEKVAPLTLLRNPEVDRHRINAEGDVVTAGGTTTILGEDVVAAMGPRRPDHAHSQKEFRLGFVFLTRPGTEPSLDDLEAVERVRRAFGAHFFALTNGAGWADTSLGTPARGTPAPAPDLARALAWLAARQGLDGSWEDSPQTRVRDTASAVAALLRARTGLPAAQRGTAWLSVARPESLDFQARAVLAVDASRLAPVERAARLSGILAAQNPDGGFGAGRDFASDPLDTALAMRALRSLGQAPDARVERAVQALAALANPDGGWPAVVGGETSTVATAEALLALLDWSDVPGSAALRGNGLTALVARQNPDGGFGSSPSTPYASALALDVLLRSGGAAPLVEPLTAWLQAAQLADGSWGSSAWQTALVVAALGQALGSNLVVPGDSLIVAPSPAREGDVVRVTARVRNSGRAPAPATVARLFDGDPASTPALGEAPVGPLAPGEEAEVAFDYPTVDRPGTRTLHVVADAASQAAESREDDNTTSRPLTVEGLLADLVVGPEDVQVSPAGPEVGETVSVIVAVRNAGQRASSPAAVAVRISGPSGGRADLPPVTLPALPPAGAASVSVPWRPAWEGAHVVRVAADALYQLPEADETNNAVDRPVTVVAQAPEDPELAVVGATVMPAALEEVPQPIEVRAVVENSGRAAATTAVTVIDSQTGSWLGTADVELPARATRQVVLHGSLSTAGARSLSVVVDPDARIAEGDEANNTFSISLLDARTYDLELVAGALSETDVELGQTITATAEVRNRGTVDVLGIPVQLAHDAAGGPAELARTTISLNAGDSGTVVLRWPTSLTGGALPLSLRVDPFDLLPERREDNNAAALGLSVRPSGRANLAVSGAEVTLAPDPLVEGEGATLSAVVRNTGAAAAPSFRVRFVVGDPDAGGVVVGETAVDRLAAGADVAAALAWPRVDLRGSLGLHVIADAGGEVEESREDDNRAFRPFSAIGLPDLVLAAADVVLDPGYPRAGEAVTVRATVRNLGGRSSGAPTELAVTEGEPGAGVQVGRLPVPALEPGAFVSLAIPWTPGAPPGPRPLSLVLDPGALVEEQDEGNNEVRRTVVAQDADFFLTEPVFSPDGDGVKDETTLAWRATGRVTVVVSNARGEAVRTLVEDGPETGSVTWDGRTARGTVAWDGSYTASVTGEGGASLGSASLALDTNRSPIHDASPRQTTVRNLTCALPEAVRGPAWTAGEDEALYIVPVVQPGFPVGLLRASTDGGYSYVAQDVWYGSAVFPSPAAVAPDGRDVLVRVGGQAFLVDLATGERRPLAPSGYSASWSPDGRFILAGTSVLGRDGSVLAEVAWGEWAWSPDSERLARVDTSYTEQALGEVVLVARDGTSLGSVTLPGGEAAAAQYLTIQKGPVWRGDGKIVASVFICVDVGGEAAECRDISFVVDPDALEATRLTFPASFGAWSPDGGRVLFEDGRLYLEDGTSLGPLLPSGSVVSPRASTATYRKPAWDTRLPGTACGTKGGDTFAITSSANLSAQLDVARLPGNGGLVIRGTAADRNLERFQLDYASAADTATWHPIGAALDVPVIDDILTVWVPPGPGTYVLRLSVSDLAGHASVRTRVVSWERVPTLANFTQSDYYLSPDGNGVKDAVLFRYTVLDPTRVDVRVVGPEPLGAGPAAREVWRAAFEHPTVGPRSFSWDGRDASGQVVPDGRYTVHVNDLPFRVEVDNTPPEIGMRFENLHAAPARIKVAPKVAPGCNPNEILQGFGDSLLLSSVAADRAWHVVDDRLKSWVFRGPGRAIFGDTEPVYVPEIGPYGVPVLEGGRPRVLREAGRPVDRVGAQYVLHLAQVTGLTLEAWDLAGNHSEVPVDPPAEGLFALGAVWRERCETLASLLAPEQSGTGKPVNELRPEKVVLQVGTTQHVSPDGQDLRLAFEPVVGGLRREIAVSEDFYGHRNLHIGSFETLGVDPTLTYRGRFVGRGQAGEISSTPFLFSPCPQWLRAGLDLPNEPDPKLHVVAVVQLDTPVQRATALLSILREGAGPEPAGTLELAPMDASQLRRFLMVLRPGETAFFAPLPEMLIDCANRLRVEVRVRDVEGREYPNKDLEDACEKLDFETPPRCSFSLRLGQDFPGCSGSPDVLRVESAGSADQPARVTIEGGPVDEPRILDDFVFEPTPLEPGFHRKYEVSVEGLAGDAYPVRGRIVPLDPVFGEGSGAQLSALIDRSPPVGEILLPPEGGSLCRAPDAPLPTLQTLVRVDDASPHVEAQASWQTGDGSWRVVPRICDARCQRERTVPVGRPFELAWNVAELGSGPQTLRLEFCDRSGNRGEAVRSLLVTDAAPTLQVWRIEHPVFSPNGDGLAEQAEVTVRLPQPGRLSVRVHAGSAQGPVVRTLWTEVPQAAMDVLVAWNGRGDGGQVLADGEYALVFSIADACGGENGQSTVVTVDTVPPEVEIAEPSSGQRVSASVDVLGRATDPHFAEWVLDLSCGEATDWTRLERRTLPVGPGSFLGRWDTSRAPPGVCRLRLAAMDEAENRSAEAFATATVERGELLEGLSATPDVFSPNGDGRRETVTLGYALRRSAWVRLEVRAAGSVVRTLETGEERAAGPWSHVWDGLDDSDQPAAEGVLTLWVRAEDPAAATVYEEKTIRLDLDRTPPRVKVSRPEPDGFVGPATTVRGIVEDRNLALFTVEAAPAGSAAVELARGSQGSAAERDLGSLSRLAEGPHVLRVAASDTAENETRLDRPFFMDATPPRAAIQTPATGAFLRRGETPIPVTGLVGDEHLESWTLRFGEGREPPAFVTIGQGVVGGAGIALGAWDVRFVPDGLYTLSLVATDRAGQKTESRIAVTLDGRPPVVAFALPTDGSYVTGDGPVLGTANDAHLASWELEAAPGPGATAFQWSPLGAGSASVTEGTLADWSPLPPDGVYTLRLTARDEVDLTATARATVTVDTTPPATPTGLRAKVTATRDGFGSVVLTWSPNAEPDLAGYRVLTPRAEDWGALALPAAWDDGERVEGRYTYRVLAEDAAGNQSAPATLEVRVDLTPPLVSFSAPAEDGAVAGSVDVRGTAWSADDFAEYRLLVGAGEAPATWTTLRRSSVPVASGSLGAWLALVDGTYVLALEAEDTNGNEARITRRVVVDTVPPEPPVLVNVATAATPADQLTPSWQPSPSADVVGTLVLRNGRLANASSVVLGDRKGFLVPGTSFEDRGLPDGDHCYRVVAMDGAGNESAPSNEICRSLDNRPPRALIVSPPDGARFGYPVRVLADTPDLDVTSVRFERRALGQAEWVAFGEVRSAPPWETTLDPKPATGDELAAGTHELRAVATDHAEATDPAPASIAVVYGDTTPPPAPTGLAAKVDGADVTLTWTPPEAADLASYRLYRDGARIAEDLTEPQRLDISLAPRTYAYAVTAVDADGNESASSTAAEAIVYVLRLDQPSWPVVGAPVAAATGDGSRPATTVRVLREEAGIAEAPGTGGFFRVEGVPLVPDGNVLRARGEDAAGNRSVPSDEIVLISNAPPAAVTGLAAEVDGAAVTLQWPAVADLDLAGYVVRRDGVRLTASVPQDEASSIDATSRHGIAPFAFDGNPMTAWVPGWPGTGLWTVTFAEPVLVERVSLRFAPPDGPNPGIPASYTILARWQDRDLPVVRVRGNTAAMAEHRLPAPFLTSALTIALESPAGLAEVAVERLDVVTTESFGDGGLVDGRHVYAVAAVDRYGAEGEPGTVETGIGDVDPPAPPAGLVATPVGRDVHLAWNASLEPDVTGYVVLRDGLRVGTAAAPSFVDAARPNGTYAYTVIAVDAAGHESAESEPASATVAVPPEPPSAPVILDPTDAAHPITIAVSRTDVAGRADAGSVVTLEVDGQARGAATAGPGFRRAGEVDLGSGYVALSPDGRWAAWSSDATSVSVQDLDTGAVRRWLHGGSTGAGELAFSPDGTALALSRPHPEPPYLQDVAVLRLDDGSVRVLTQASPWEYAWSPDGARLAVAQYDGSLGLVDVATGALTVRETGSGLPTYLRWSPDGTHLAFVRSWSGAAAELRLLGEGASPARILDRDAWPYAPPSWSPDGRRLAWTAAGTPLRVRVQDLGEAAPAAEIGEAGSDVLDARFSPDGSWLDFVRLTTLLDGTRLRSVHAINQRQGQRVTVAEPQPVFAELDAHDWLGGRLALRTYDQLELFAPEAGLFVVRDVPLAPSENRLVARASDPASSLSSADSETVLVTVADEAFPDLVVLPAGIVSLPPVPLATRPASLRLRVENGGGTDAGGVEVLVRVTGPGGSLVVDTRATLAVVPAGEHASLLLPWTPEVSGSYSVQVEVDPDAQVEELSEANNVAGRSVTVVAAEGLAAAIDSDRSSYPALATAHVSVQVANAGTPFTGVARTTVEDASSGQVALLDEREVSLEWGKSASFGLDWPVGTTLAGPYAFRVRLRAAGASEPSAVAERPFVIEADRRVLARVRPEPATTLEGTPVAFALAVENQGSNAPLDGATLKLRVRPAGSTGPASFETVRALPPLPPGGTWAVTDTWLSAGPPGPQDVRLEVERGGVVLAAASALVTVEAAAPAIRGTVTVTPADVLAGQLAEARVTVENTGLAGVSGYPLVVEVVSGPAATVHFAATQAADLAASESRTLTVAIETGAIPPGRHVVRLRGGASPATLDRSTLVVHGLLAPPSPHAPAPGERVGTAQPTLVVNDGSSPEGAPLTYEFALFGDEALTQGLPGARGVAETASRTSWTVLARLAEDSTYWWRARATDGFSTSPWSAVASFTVDAVNRPPTSPVPDTPSPGARVASRQPPLTVRNALDPEGQPMTYAFRLATDEAMSAVVAAQAGVAEGLGLTTWVPPVVLDEGVVYWWSARARTAGEGPEDLSPWSAPVAFRVDTVNGSPTVPSPLRPVGGAEVATRTPALVVGNATDPEDDPLAYRFEIDSRPSLDSPERQEAAGLPPGPGETAWTPPLELLENTAYFWRAHASDGTTETPSPLASFFVDVANEAPGAPLPLDPVDHRTVGTPTPTLRLRNAVDPEGDALAYAFEVRDAEGAIVAAAATVPAGPGETTWTVDSPLAENHAFTWRARANDGALDGRWSDPAAFRVDAVAEPPTAPVPLLPADGAVVEERRPPLVVENATSPDGLALLYAFELESVAADGSTTLVERVEGVPEAPETTAWTAAAELADGRYQWRSRANDPRQSGLWSATSRFSVLVDRPPAAPLELRARAGDARVRLDWLPSPEADVTGYRVLRSTTAGGPHAFVAAVDTAGFDDTGLANGVTYYYVVTAVDAGAESPPSNEAAARPEAPSALEAEVRYDPAMVRAECLLPEGQSHHARGDLSTWAGLGLAGRDASPVAEQCHRPPECPAWLHATLELPAGHDPATIEVGSLRVFGSVAADSGYGAIADVDADGVAELRVRFAFEAVAPHLSVGAHAAAIVGRAGGVEVRGTGRIDVAALAPNLRVTPRTLQRRSCGQEVLARITFAPGVDARDVEVGSVRLNGVVKVQRVVHASRRELKLKFDRGQVVGVLPLGSSVEVRVTGTVRGIPFVGVDHIRVIE